MENKSHVPNHQPDEKRWEQEIFGFHRISTRFHMVKPPYGLPWSSKKPLGVASKRWWFDNQQIKVLPSTYSGSMMTTSGHSHEKLGEGFGHQIWWLISSHHVEASHTDLTFEDPHGCFDPTNHSMVPVCGSTLWNLRITYPVLGQIMARPTKKGKIEIHRRPVALCFLPCLSDPMRFHTQMGTRCSVQNTSSTVHHPLWASSEIKNPFTSWILQYPSVGEYTFFDGLPLFLTHNEKKTYPYSEK